MKKTGSVIIPLIVLMAAFSTAFAFTWEGELNPDEFDNWELISIQPASQGYLWVFIENPDQTSTIDVVVMRVGLDDTLRSYRYFKYGEPHLFVYNASQDRYIEVPLTEKGKRGCMKCHQKAAPVRQIAVVY